MLAWWARIRSEVDWQLKSMLRFSPTVRLQGAGSWDGLLNRMSSLERARFDALSERHDLAHWPGVLDDEGLRWNLYVLDVLVQTATPPEGSGPSLDVGSRHWGYLPALAAFRPGPWRGVELDGHQRYADLTTRAARAEAMTKVIPDASYRVACVTDERNGYHLVTWLHPFVSPEPLEAAGLPTRYLQPRELLAHVWERVTPGGLLWLINHDAEEDGIQRELFDELGIEATRLGPLASPFQAYDTPRFGWVARRPALSPPGSASS